jgi:hypothetical protein
MSALGISVALFALSGAFWIVIGALTPPLLNPTGGRFLIISARTDLALFGAAAPELIAADPALGRLRTIVLVMLAGMLLASGIFEIAVALFALREGHAWALAALVLAHAAVLPFWWTVFEPYRAAGTRSPTCRPSCGSRRCSPCRQRSSAGSAFATSARTARAFAPELDACLLAQLQDVETARGDLRGDEVP